MRHLWIAAVVGLVVGCGKASPPPAPAHRAVKGDVAIVGGTVVPMDQEGRALPAHTVLLRGDQIVAVAPAAQVDVRDATVIDAQGQWVLPGLADMHVHMWSQRDLQLFVLNGVTTVRNLFGSPEHVRWRDAVARGELVGPRIINAGPILDGAPPTWPGSAVVTTADEARAAVQAQKAAGYEWLKVYNSLSAEAYDAIVDEAKRVGLPVGGHVPRAVGIDKVIAAKQVTIEHLDGYVPFMGETPPPAPLVEATVKAGVWNCATLVVTERFGRMDKPELLATTRGLELVSQMMRESWKPENDFRLKRYTPELFEALRKKNEERRALVGALNQAGAKLVLGTDTGNPYVVPGFAVVDELELLVASGLTPWQALRTATVAAAELQGLAGRAGVLQAGARADVIVVGKDPLITVTNVADPSVVIAGGRVHRRADLLAELTRKALPPAEQLAALAPLPDEGEAVVKATYEVHFLGEVIGAERATLAKIAGGAPIVYGQALYTDPPSQTRYRSSRDELDLTTTSIDPPHVVITRKGAVAVAVQDGQPPKELAAAADAVLAPQTIGEFIWYAQALADLEVGKTRTLTAVEARTEGALVLDPGTFTFTRSPDAEGRRVYAVKGSVGPLALEGSLAVDADGAPHDVTLTMVYGTFGMRRIATP